MDVKAFNEAGSSGILTVKSIANKLILILEDIIEMISVNSDNIRGIKDKAQEAKAYIKELDETVIAISEHLSKDQSELYKREMNIYNAQYIDDVVTSWILNGSKTTVLDSLYTACYKIRELLKNISYT